MEKLDFLKEHAALIRSSQIKVYLGRGKWTALIAEVIKGRLMYIPYNLGSPMYFNEAVDYVYRIGLASVQRDAERVKITRKVNRDGTQETEFKTFIHGC